MTSLSVIIRLQLTISELEDLLLKHPDVDDAAVIGVYKPDEATEVPKAYGKHAKRHAFALDIESFLVVLSASAKGKSNPEVAIAAWVAARVANHKKLRGGVQVTDVIPKSPSGKILRRLLKDRYGPKTLGTRL